MSLSTDPNMRRLQKIKRGIVAGSAGVPVAVVSWLGVIEHASLLGMVAAGGLSFFVTMFIGGTAADAFGNDRTPALPSVIPRNCVAVMINRLAAITTDGLKAGDRSAVQREIDDARSQLRHMLGTEPWIACAHRGTRKADEHMALRSVRLRESDLGQVAGERHGTTTQALVMEIGDILPTIVATIHDFGLDASGFEADDRRLPGQSRYAPAPLPQLAAPVRSLALEWTSGDNSGVPTLERIIADSTATRDLDKLEADWANARASALPEDVESVDARFLKGAATISASLSEAIALRGRTDRDTLETTVRYIEMKAAS